MRYLGAVFLVVVSMAFAQPVTAQSVTIEHKYGSTTVPETPTRVVTVGLVEQDALLALGVVPVGTTEWYGEQPGALWPWAQAELETLGGELPTVVGGPSGSARGSVSAGRPDGSTVTAFRIRSLARRTRAIRSRSSARSA